MADALAAASPAIWDWDAATGAFLASEAFLRIHGFPPQSSISLDDFIACILGADAGWASALARQDLTLPATVRYRIRRADDGGIRWMRSRLTPAFAGTGSDVVAVTGIAEDVTEIEQATQSLAESERRLRLAVEAGRMAVWEVDLDTGQLAQSRELNALLGLPPTARPALSDVRKLYAPGELERLTRDGVTREVVRERAAQGHYSRREDGPHAMQDRTQLQAEFSLITPAGVSKRLMLRAQYALVGEERQTITGVLVDLTEQAHARERLAVVARELRHRVKNTLSIAQALATQTFRNHTDVNAALEDYGARLRALGSATDSMLTEDVDETDLHTLAHKITGPYREPSGSNLRIEGEAIALSAKSAAAVGMVLHELSTNAVKYGSLSASPGHVALTWRRVEPGHVVEMKWTESGGPPVREPQRLGFGTRLVRSLVSRDLGGTFDVLYAATGLRATITFDVARQGKQGEAATSL